MSCYSCHGSELYRITLMVSMWLFFCTALSFFLFLFNCYLIFISLLNVLYSCGYLSITPLFSDFISLRLYSFKYKGQLCNFFWVKPRYSCYFAFQSNNDGKILSHLFYTMLSLVGSEDGAKFKNLENWSCAIGYGLGSGSPLSPSFNFGLELAKNSQVLEFSVHLFY